MGDRDYVGGTEHVAMWNAIEAVVVASGGKTNTSVARMKAVARVEAALRDVVAAADPRDARIAELEAALSDARDALHRDRTGLGKALETIVRSAKASAWVASSRGPYEWNDDEYKLETGRFIGRVLEVAEAALRDSGNVANAGVDAAERALGRRK